MRLNGSYHIKEHFSAIRKVLITRLSLWLLKFYKPRELVVIRDGGLGDCVMATSLVDALKEEHTASKLVISASFPELFTNYDTVSDSFFTFPVIWLSYTPYDFVPWVKKEPIHCSQIMAKFAGLRSELRVRPSLKISALNHKDFFAEYIEKNSYIVIQPTAGNWLKEKNWETTNWALLICELNKQSDIIYQVGAHGDPIIEGTIDLRGKTTVNESILLIKHAQLVVGVNSFAEQVAWSYDVPSVILYGPTNPRYSLNPNQMAVYSDQIVPYEMLKTKDYEFPSMQEIEVETVLRAVEQVNQTRFFPSSSSI